GNKAALLSYVVSAMVPAGPEAIVPRVAGWLCGLAAAGLAATRLCARTEGTDRAVVHVAGCLGALAAAALAATFLWPRNERRDLYNRLAEALRPLAAAIRAAAGGEPTDQALHDANAAIERGRDEQRELGFRPIGPPEHQEALGGLVDALGQAWRFASLMAASD